jgi:dTDP-glucose 4,6-dehydratase
VRAYHETYGLATTISNCSNNYGPYQHPEKLIPKAISNIFHGETVPIYGDGQNIRDWLYVEDHCRAIDLIMDLGAEGGVYNVGGDNQLKNLELVIWLGRYIGDRVNSNDYPAQIHKDDKELYHFVKDRVGHDLRYAINSEYIHNALGFECNMKLTDGLALTIDWYCARIQENI